MGLSTSTGASKAGAVACGIRRKASTGEALPGQSAQAAVTQTARTSKVRNDQRYFARDLNSCGLDSGADRATLAGSCFPTRGWVASSRPKPGRETLPLPGFSNGMFSSLPCRPASFRRRSTAQCIPLWARSLCGLIRSARSRYVMPVSYTHLTLPTILRV